MPSDDQTGSGQPRQEIGVGALAGLQTDNAALMAELTDRLRVQQEREREMAFAMSAGGLGTWSLELPERELTASAACKELFT